MRREPCRLDAPGILIDTIDVAAADPVSKPAFEPRIEKASRRRHAGRSAGRGITP